MNKILDYNKLHNVNIKKNDSYLNVDENQTEIKEYILKNVSKDAKILELGAGGGTFSNWLYVNGFNDLVVTDCSEVATSLILKRFPHLKTKIVDAENINIFGFDVVISLDLIEHLRDPQSHLEIIFNTLNPQGIYIIKTPNKFWEDIYYKKILLRKDKEKKHIWWSGHISLMTFETLRKKLRKTGFTPEFIKQKKLTKAQEKKIKLICPSFLARTTIVIGNLIFKIIPKSLNIQFICIAKKYE